MHIHIFAWRLEHTFGDRDGLVATTALGLGLGDDHKTKRIGSGGLLQLGYRFPVARNVVTVQAPRQDEGGAWAEGAEIEGLQRPGRESRRC